MDVGGTSVKLGLVRAARILHREAIPTAAVSGRPKRLIDLLVEQIARWRGQRRLRLSGVGVGVPGLVDYPSGVVRSCVNLTGWHQVPLRRMLSRRLGLPVAVDNDVNAMTLAEWRYGAGRGSRNLVCLALGTGVGGGLILDGKFYHSRRGPSGEIGHLPLAAAGPACVCGGQACLERFVGNRDLLNRVGRKLAAGTPSILRTWLKAKPTQLSPELIDRACEAGDPFARSVWEEAGFQIGLSLVQVVNLLAPDKIVIGGGIAQAGRWLFPAIRRTVRRRAMRGLGAVPIVPARLGPAAGLIGAALLVQGEGS